MELLKEQADRRTAGATNAATRADEREVLLNEIEMISQALRTAVQATAADLSDQHRVRADCKTALGVSVLEMFDDKLAEIACADVVFSDALSDGEEVTQTEVDRDQAVRDAELAQQRVNQLAAAVQKASGDQDLLNQTLEQQREDASTTIEALKQQVTDLQSRTAQTPPPQGAAPEVNLNTKRYPMQAEFETVAADFDISRLPQISSADLDNPSKLLACSNLHLLLTQWLQSGAAVPFTFAALAQHSAAGLEVSQLITRLLGTQSTMWFPADKPMDELVLPRQAVLAVYQSLESAKALYEAKECERHEAAKSFSLISAEAKKRRTSPATA